jgi:hypothetical protein
MEGVDHLHQLRSGIDGPTALDEEEGAPWTNDLSPSRHGSPVGPSRDPDKRGVSEFRRGDKGTDDQGTGHLFPSGCEGSDGLDRGVGGLSVKIAERIQRPNHPQ